MDLVDRMQDPDKYDVAFPATALGLGIYLLNFQTAEMRITLKVTDEP